MLKPLRGVFSAALLIVGIAASSVFAWAQVSGTGALSGTVVDASGAVVPDAHVRVINEATAETRNVTTGDNGTYLVPLLPPGNYRVEVQKQGFKPTIQRGVSVIVRETNALTTALEVGTSEQTVTVEASAEQLQTQGAALGRVTGTDMVAGLPLVTRNFTQIIGLNAGIGSDVQDASGLGRGNSTGYGAVGGVPDFSANGAVTQDNSYLMDGADINDIMSTGSFSGGIAIPNPDAILEFKVQTGQYDAATGRNSGANVNVVTKSGTNQFHGNLWEFLRNNDMNANSFFRNKAGAARPLLRQNQYGLTFGGPILKDKLFFFASWQGTRQLNGVNAACSSNVYEPAFTNDRSAAALGSLFAGQRGKFQGTSGPAIAADGSNINPAALALLNLKLPNGQYAIPTPQIITQSAPFATQGFSAFSQPCKFTEDQGMFNVDYVQSGKSKFALRFFIADDTTTQTINTSNAYMTGTPVPGFPILRPITYYNFSLAHTYLFSNNLFNSATFGFHYTPAKATDVENFTYSNVGIAASGYDNIYPVVGVAGSAQLGGSGQGDQNAERTSTVNDTLSYVRGRHLIRVGGDYTFYNWDVVDYHSFGGILAQSWPDLLLGLSAAQNGSSFSNIYTSFDDPGLFGRKFRVHSASAFVQDDIKVTPRFTLNLGLRYELYGQFGDELGRQGIFNWALANPTPPPSGSYNGFVVASNYQGVLPPGVTRSPNTSASEGQGENTWNPRLGFAYRLPGTDRVVLRGGYGGYHQRLVGYAVLQTMLQPPFAQSRLLTGTTNAAATLQNPFGPYPSLPNFPAYSPTTNLNFLNFAPNIRPPFSQTYNFQAQTKLTNSMVLEIGYVGRRGLHLLRNQSYNEAMWASPSNPIRGVTTDTLANLTARLPVEGFSAPGPDYMETEGSSWYNALQVSLSKRVSHGVQFLASYTYARLFATDVNTSNFPGPGGNATGEQNHPGNRYGPDQFVRPHRFVISYVWELPWLRNSKSLAGSLLGGWSLSGATTIQSGERLTLLRSNVNNVYGITADRAEIAPGCTYSQLLTSGAIQSRLTKYFNTACVTTPPIVGSDGIATDFGNSGVGIVTGPGQDNFDMSLGKRFRLGWPNEKANLEFRAEGFNIFNHPQFSNPDNNTSNSTFGYITSVSVNARIMQLALKFNF